MFERFTDRARRVLVLAQEEARILNHNFIGTEHLLLGLMSEGDGVAAKALAELGAIDLIGIRLEVGKTIGPSGSDEFTGSPPFTPRSKKVLELSLREALQLGHSYIGTEHLLLGLVREGEGVAAQVLVASGLTLASVRAKVIELLTGHAADAAAGIERAVPVGTSRFSSSGVRRPRPRFTPAGLAVATNALGRVPAGGFERLGSHHYLLAHFDDPLSLAARVLESLGVTEAAVADRIQAMGIAGTTDEVPEPDPAGTFELGLGGGFTLRIDDSEMATRMRATIDAVGGRGEAGGLAKVIRSALAEYLVPPDDATDERPEPDEEPGEEPSP